MICLTRRGYPAGHRARAVNAKRQPTTGNCHKSRCETTEQAFTLRSGLAGSVWTQDVERGLEIAAHIRTGTFGVNLYANDPYAPFGDYKHSGIGRENGREGLESYLEHKSVMLPLGYPHP
jgi:acyl-CoA reductase-like NAD-dependent aldehyde dehydrogenase